ncbi:MAG: hypothetical protein ACRCX2_04900 [Paraclostridium sp.]
MFHSLISILKKAHEYVSSYEKGCHHADDFFKIADCTIAPYLLYVASHYALAYKYASHVMGQDSFVCNSMYLHHCTLIVSLMFLCFFILKPEEEIFACCYDDNENAICNEDENDHCCENVSGSEESNAVLEKRNDVNASLLFDKDIIQKATAQAVEELKREKSKRKKESYGNIGADNNAVYFNNDTNNECSPSYEEQNYNQHIHDNDSVGNPIVL